MKQLLIIRAGSTYLKAQEMFGHYEQFFLDRMTKPPVNCISLNAQVQPEYPVFNSLRGIIISGAHENVTEQAPWMLHLKNWLKNAHEAHIPVLGVCFGHQIMGAALGGKVDFNELGGEYGLIEVIAVNGFKLFDLPIPRRFNAYASHEQSIVELPKNAQSLAGNKIEPNHIVHFGNKSWGVQFHPEFTRKIMKFYLEVDDTPGKLGSLAERKQIEGFGRNLLDAFIKYTETE